MIPVTTFAGKHVAVFGLGASGNATAQALTAGGAIVSAWDDGAAGREGAARLGIPLEDLSTADWSKFAALVLAPGVPLTHPEPHWTVKKARAAGVEVIGDIELFCRERTALCPEAPFIAITGTNGKSTTTALIAHILREAGRDVQMGGNIGRPILDLEPLAADRFYVIEMSSFQIDLTTNDNLKPTVGVMLNITPDHLDRHGPADDLADAMCRYRAIKERLVEGGGLAVVGVDDAESRAIATSLTAAGKRLVAISAANAGGRGVWWADGQLFRSDERREVVDLEGVISLRGAHNGQNAAAAYAVCEALGVDREAIARAMRTYPGLPHRMEEIGRVGEVLFINDSKATNADSTEKALLTFPRNVYWILGGKPKEGGITSLAKYFPGIAKAYLIGAATDEFARTLEGKVPFERCGTLDVAVAKAAADAASLSSPGTGEDVPQGQVRGFGPTSTAGPTPTTRPTPTPDPSPQGGGESAAHFSLPLVGRAGVGVGEVSPVVLLSPACASYDQFKNFEVRGDAFRALVAALPGFVKRGPQT